ncbi:MAG: SDR family oxidoreductase [Cytophagales bacterium]|nr:SDR family oxidoreductase [Armatimonadota bacterium]
MILVTGATGNIGSALIAQLTAQGVPVRALVRDRNEAERSGRLPAKTEIVEGDLLRPETLTVALDGVKKAFLLVPADPRLAEMHESFVAAAMAAGVQHLVKSSALGAATGAPVRFWDWHGQGETLVKDAGIPWTLLQPTNFAQGFLQFAPVIQQQNAFFDPLGTAPVSYVDVRDIAAVAARTLTDAGEAHQGRTYVLTGGEALTGEQVAALLSEAAGRTIAYQAISFEDFGSGAEQMGVPKWQAEGLIELYRALAAGAGKTLSPDVEAVTGKPPRTTAAFLREARAAFVGA